MTDTPSTCVACGRSSRDVPLVAFEYRGHPRHICTQHLPVLIHKPEQLAQMLPGAEGIGGADH